MIIDDGSVLDNYRNNFIRETGIILEAGGGDRP
jgi:hypothetical protein